MHTALGLANMGANVLIHGRNLEKGKAILKEISKVSGKYFENQRIARSSTISYDTALQERLWKIGEKLTGLA